MNKVNNYLLFFLTLFSYYFFLVYIRGFEKKSVLVAMTVWILLDFQNVQEVKMISKLTASIDVKLLFFEFSGVVLDCIDS